MILKEFSVYYLDKSYRADWNWVKLGRNETMNHHLAKLEVAKQLVIRGLPFLTECQLTGFGRVDVISPLSNEIFECLESETDAVFANKTFPKEFVVRKMKYDSKLKTNVEAV